MFVPLDVLVSISHSMILTNILKYTVLTDAIKVCDVDHMSPCARHCFQCVKHIASSEQLHVELSPQSVDEETEGQSG